MNQLNMKGKTTTRIKWITIQRNVLDEMIYPKDIKEKTNTFNYVEKKSSFWVRKEK